MSCSLTSWSSFAPLRADLAGSSLARMLLELVTAAAYEPRWQERGARNPPRKGGARAGAGRRSARRRTAHHARRERERPPDGVPRRDGRGDQSQPNGRILDQYRTDEPGGQGGRRRPASGPFGSGPPVVREEPFPIEERRDDLPCSQVDILEGATGPEPLRQAARPGGYLHSAHECNQRSNAGLGPRRSPSCRLPAPDAQRVNSVAAPVLRNARASASGWRGSRRCPCRSSA